MNTFQRIISILVDFIIMSIISFVVVLPIFFNLFNGLTDGNFYKLDMSFSYAYFAILFAFSLFFNKDGINGASIGKKIFSHKVFDLKTNSTASSLKCFVRNITLLLWPIEVFAILINPERRIGDYIAGTKVSYSILNNPLKKPFEFKNLLFSLFLGMILIAFPAYYLSQHFNSNAFDKPIFIESSYNQFLSDKINKQIMDYGCNQYLRDVYVRVYDEVKDDTVKYISAVFFLKYDNISNENEFKDLKEIIFNNIFKVIPKGQFILYGKFNYEGEEKNLSNYRYYDWREE